MPFRDDFRWGTATASYQIEGAHDADGKGPSVWDRFVRWPGKVQEGDRGDVACDHYHRYRDDVALMRHMGLKAYRFSVSWSRVMPQGTGPVNEPGLAFYDRLVDELLGAGVEPWLTLFHWDYPLALFHRGGWLNPDSPQWFADYAAVLADRLGDRVKHWMTLNEPQCFLGIGHLDGVHAPGLKLDLPDVMQAAHHAMLAHGRAVQVLRSRCKARPTVGWAPVGIIRHPANNDPRHVDAARKAMFSVTEPNLWNNAWFFDPVVFGRYPEDGMKVFERALPTVREGDMALISQPLDFLGANIYVGLPTLADGTHARPQGFPRSLFYWPVEPDAMYWGPKFLQERYKLPIVITENGMACHDTLSLDGKVHDPNRIDFLHRYLRRLRDAADAGVDIRGYFQWSLLDNFEWAEGYRMRFGLIYTDYATQQRIPKDSAAWYRGVIASNGASL